MEYYHFSMQRGMDHEYVVMPSLNGETIDRFLARIYFSYLENIERHKEIKYVLKYINHMVRSNVIDSNSFSESVET